jgi:hypothetical protein
MGVVCEKRGVAFDASINAVITGMERINFDRLME